MLLPGRLEVFAGPNVVAGKKGAALAAEHDGAAEQEENDRSDSCKHLERASCAKWRGRTSMCGPELAPPIQRQWRVGRLLSHAPSHCRRLTARQQPRSHPSWPRPHVRLTGAGEKVTAEIFRERTETMFGKSAARLKVCLNDSDHCERAQDLGI
jgi:hypothetical protein